MNSLFLVAQVAGESVAILSDDVESVVRVENSVQVPGASPVIAGLFALRSRVLTLIDTQYYITGQKKTVAEGDFCVVTEIDGHPYGLLVDVVNDVVNINEKDLVNIGFANGKWRTICNGMVTHEDNLLLLLNSHALVNVDHNLAA